MCGIAGFVDTSCQMAAGELGEIAGAMARTIAHRGPDEQNVWCDEAGGVAFGHRRLSIVDLSAAGRQPMVSASGRTVICYNGEIYNPEELKAALGDQVARYRGHSDTEVLLEAAETFGPEEAISRANGMFALAIWQRDARRLWLVRDRLGIKPLYWSMQAGVLLFASELRPFHEHPGFSADLDRGAIAAYMRHNYIPHPHTVFQGVHQLPPGHMLRLDHGGEPVVERYWELAGAVRDGRRDRFEGSDAEAVDALEALLRDAVGRRMVADVPLGAFLSGGYDSSTVVALMQAQADRPVKTFSIGFHEQAFNEAEHAAAVAGHLGTEHTELYVTPDEARDVIPRLAQIYDEPFADSSQVPTHLVSMLARQHVTVALSGDGGDELFTGYNRYAVANRFNQVTRVPKVLRQAGAGAAHALSPDAWDQVFRVVPARFRPRLAGDKVYKLADVVGETGDGFYHRLISHWREPEEVVRGAREPATVVTDRCVEELVPNFIERMQYRDTLTYLPCDILTKVDRASMAVSLEARVPLLDHRVVEFAWRLPLEMKLRRGTRKWILREVLYRHVPRALVDRPKMGFGIPIDRWLRGPLRDWAEDLLAEKRLREGGIFDPAPIRARWVEHLGGRRNHQYALWNVIMFEAWRDAWR